MYAGHLAVGLAANRARPRVPLWLLLIASQAPDWLELLLRAAGRDDAHEVWSHSIPIVITGGLLFAAYHVIHSGDWAGGVLLVVVALSHSLLDLVTGSKTLWPGFGPVGACIYDQPAVDFVVEAAIAAIGWAIYRTGFPKRKNALAMLAVLVALVGSQAALDAAQELRLIQTPSVRRQCIDAARN